MSDNDAAYDPYRAPELEKAPPLPPSKSERPGWLTAICILALLLGAMGGLSALGTLVMTAAAPMMMQALSSAPTGQMDEMTRLQVEMQEKNYEVMRQYWVANLVSGVVHLGLAVMMVIGAIFCLSGRARGRKLLIGVFLATALFEMVRVVPAVFQMTDSWAVSQEYTERIVKAAPGMPQGGPNPMDFMQTFMGAMLVVQFVVMGVWVLVKLIFYGMAAKYLARHDIRGLYEGADAVYGSPPG